ncbi:hypothetical protein BU15DRAFT_69358, partial [Melanogaster broomeanus]
MDLLPQDIVPSPQYHRHRLTKTYPTPQKHPSRLKNNPVASKTASSPQNRDRDRDKDTEREQDRDKVKEGQERLRNLSDKCERPKDRDQPGSTVASQSQQTTLTRVSDSRDPPRKKDGESNEDWRRGSNQPRTGRERPENGRRDRDDRERPRSRVRDSSRTVRDGSSSRREKDDRRTDRDDGYGGARRDKEDRDRDLDRDSEPDDPRRWRDDGKRDERIAARRDRENREREREGDVRDRRDRPAWDAPPQPSVTAASSRQEHDSTNTLKRSNSRLFSSPLSSNLSAPRPTAKPSVEAIITSSHLPPISSSRRISTSCPGISNSAKRNWTLCSLCVFPKSSFLCPEERYDNHAPQAPTHRASKGTRNSPTDSPHDDTAARGPDESTTDQMADGVSLAAPASHPTDGPHDDTAARGLARGHRPNNQRHEPHSPCEQPKRMQPTAPPSVPLKGSGIVGRRAATPQMCRELPRAQGTRTARAPANSMTQ